jgi:hypothetical protein
MGVNTGGNVSPHPPTARGRQSISPTIQILITGSHTRVSEQLTHASSLNSPNDKSGQVARSPNPQVARRWMRLSRISSIFRYKVALFPGVGVGLAVRRLLWLGGGGAGSWQRGALSGASSMG